jgi:predicted DNA-binding transcriptional regulator AlpA
VSRAERLTVAELCAELGISRSTFCGWRAKKRAPRCIKLPNGDLRIRRAGLDRWLDAHEDAADGDQLRRAGLQGRRLRGDQADVPHRPLVRVSTAYSRTHKIAR